LFTDLFQVKAKLTPSRSSSPVGIIGIEAFMGENEKFGPKKVA
jgi:hypothetical protein